MLWYLIPASIDEKGVSMPISRKERRLSDYEDNLNSDQVTDTQITFMSLLSIPSFLIAAIGAVMSMFMMLYLEPIMSFRLQEFDMSPAAIGLFFVLQPAAYITFSLSTPSLMGSLSNRGTLMIGAGVGAFSMLLVGPSNFLPNSLEIMILGQIMVGICGLLLLVPVIPELVSCASSKYRGSVVEITDISAGVFN